MKERLALLSVSDKTGVVDLARGLVAAGFRLLSTGGTAKLLADAGLAVGEVAAHTGSPEMLDGRVKTLHPRIHGGLLGRRDVESHRAAMEANAIAPIDVLCVNLYPFEATVAKADCTLADAIENIDIGGPAMIRSAAKNWRDVAVLTDPSQYADLLGELANGGTASEATRFRLAVAAFDRIADYDAAISGYLSSLAGPAEGVPKRAAFGDRAHGRFVKLQDLRYGENPHQQAAFYRDLHPVAGSLVAARQLQGKELSYNNIADADAAWECVKSLRLPRVLAGDAGVEGAACVIVKHANPCGAALGADAAEAYGKAFATDPTSAFGGIIALDVTVDGAAASAIARQFVEVLIAPAFTDDALAVFRAKANTRLLQIALPTDAGLGRNAEDVKRVGSGLLVQTADRHDLADRDLVVRTRRAPTAAERRDLLFAWRVATYVKSNAIVFARGDATVGVGAGQMSRLDSARIAAIKAGAAGLSLVGSAVASDAFFPFRDGLDVVADAGATAVIQPGGSVRDDEVIAAADERGLAMVFTGVRHFRH